jgi:hypothetical protein
MLLADSGSRQLALWYNPRISCSALEPSCFPNHANVQKVDSMTDVSPAPGGLGAQAQAQAAPQVSGAKHIASRFMAESLMNRAVLQQTEAQPMMQLLPDTTVIKIGGQSIMDRGRTALLPVVDELGANLAAHKLIISVGEGTRARHAYDIATDLGLPTGVLSVMGDVIANQNALIVTTIMMRYGAVRVPEDHFDMFPIFLNSGCPIVINGMAPYRWWEQPPEFGRVPESSSSRMSTASTPRIQTARRMPSLSRE